MKVSQLLNIMQEILITQGDLEIVGECADCEKSGMEIWVMTDDDLGNTCWLQVASPDSI